MVLYSTINSLEQQMKMMDNYLSINLLFTDPSVSFPPDPLTVPGKDHPSVSLFPLHSCSHHLIQQLFIA